jgi:hypothetical protein
MRRVGAQPRHDTAAVSGYNVRDTVAETANKAAEKTAEMSRCPLQCLSPMARCSPGEPRS